MRWAEASVPLQTRVTVWISCVAIGVAMYFVFGSVLTAAPAREREEVRGKIEAVMAQVLGARAKAPAEEPKAGIAKTRATISLLGALHKREADLGQECRAKRFWAVLIGLVAGGGCFALCSVYWLGRGAREAAHPSRAPVELNRGDGSLAKEAAKQ